MKKVLLMAWLALYACMLQAQTVNLFNESSIGMGDSIDQVKYQVVYDAEYIYEKKYTKTDTIIGRIEEKMLLQIGNKYSAFYSYPIFQRDSTISANMAKEYLLISPMADRSIGKYIRTIQNRARLPISISLLLTDICALNRWNR